MKLDGCPINNGLVVLKLTDFLELDDQRFGHGFGTINFVVFPGFAQCSFNDVT
jgi:hypothetical protein